MAGGYLSDAKIKRDMKYINDVNKIGYQNASEKQQGQMYNLRKKYGDSIYKAGKFDANKLSKSNQVVYQKYNPYAGFTQNRQSSQFNLIDQKLKNNQAVSDKQMKAYKTYGDKWNLTPHDKRSMTFQEASEQAKGQVDPLYNQAVKSVNSERYQNELNAGQIAANRGLGRSGLAADQLNKIAIATQGQISDLNAQRSTKIAELAQSLQDNDQARLERQEQFEYQKYRDTVSDDRYNTEFSYQKTRDTKDDEWRRFTYNNMSASEKLQLEWAKEQYGEDAAWRMYALEYEGEMNKAQNDATSQYYQDAGSALNFIP